MTIPFSIDPDRKLVHYTLGGTVSLEQTREFLVAVLCDPQFKRSFHFLADCRGLAGDLSAAYVRAFAREIRARAPVLGPCRWAMLCSTAGSFAAVRMCAILTHGSGIEFFPFASETHAVEWIEDATVSPMMAG